MWTTITKHEIAPKTECLVTEMLHCSVSYLAIQEATCGRKVNSESRLHFSHFKYTKASFLTGIFPKSSPHLCEKQKTDYGTIYLGTLGISALCTQITALYFHQLTILPNATYIQDVDDRDVGAATHGAPAYDVPIFDNNGVSPVPTSGPERSKNPRWGPGLDANNAHKYTSSRRPQSSDYRAGGTNDLKAHGHMHRPPREERAGGMPHFHKKGKQLEAPQPVSMP